MPDDDQKAWMRSELAAWRERHPNLGKNAIPYGTRSTWHLDKRVEGILIGVLPDTSCEEVVGSHYKNMQTKRFVKAAKAKAAQETNRNNTVD